MKLNQGYLKTKFNQKLKELNKKALNFDLSLEPFYYNDSIIGLQLGTIHDTSVGDYGIALGDFKGDGFHPDDNGIAEYIRDLDFDEIEGFEGLLQYLESATKAMFRSIVGIEPTFYNADYWLDTSRDHDIDNVEEALIKAKEGREVVGVHSHLLISDSQGIYIPQLFCEKFDLKAWNLKKSDEDVKSCLSGPDDNEWYWEAWDAILNKASHKDNFGKEWHLHQDGDLFAVHYEEFKDEEF